MRFGGVSMFWEEKEADALMIKKREAKPAGRNSIAPIWQVGVSIARRL
jgi:hypothetical protein